MMQSPQKALVVFIAETDMWHDGKLYEAIVRTLERQGIAGVTVNAGLMGMGSIAGFTGKGCLGSPTISR